MCFQMEETRERVTFRMLSKDEEGRKKVKKAETKTLNIHTLRYIEKKMVDKGLDHMERHPVDGLGLAHGPPKSGHGGKYTWEGPGDIAESELDAPVALDEGDPNFDDDYNCGDGEVADDVVGEVEVAKIAEVKEGVSRIEIVPPLQL